MLTASITTIDAHDHSPGKGAQIQAQASTLRVVGDLDFGSHNLYDIGNVTMSPSGTLKTWALSGSLTQFIPSGSTLPLAAFVGFGGIQVTTNSVGQVVISGSFPEVSDVTGSGGTSVAAVGTIWTVSSSVGPGKYASYIIASASAQAPNARLIAGLGGVSVIDNGPGSTLQISGSVPTISNLTGLGTTVVTPNGSLYTVSSSAPPWGNIYGTGNVNVSITGDQVQVSSSLGADPNASFLLAAPSAQSPNARVLVATGVALVDNGPGGTLSIQNYVSWFDTGTGIFTTSSVAIGSQGQTTASDTFFYVSGTIGLSASNGAMLAVFGGDVYASGSLYVSGNISIDGQLNSSGAYGQLASYNNGASQTLTTGGTYYIISTFNSASLSGSNMTTSVADSTLTIKEAGLYIVFASISFTGTADTYTLSLFDNGEINIDSLQQATIAPAQTNTTTVTISDPDFYAPGDVIDVRVTATGDNRTFTMVNGSFWAVKVQGLPG